MLHVVDITETIHTEYVTFGAVQIDLIQGFSRSSISCSILTGSRGQRVHWCPTDTQGDQHQYHALLHGGAVLVHPNTSLKDACKLIYTSDNHCPRQYIELSLLDLLIYFESKPQFHSTHSYHWPLT